MSKARAYHHGDLRSTLVALADKQIASAGVETISVRALARAAGVAHRAAYQHFSDKDVLVAAALAQGYQRLEARLSAVIRKTASPEDKLIAIAKAYADFAHDEPNMFLAMTGPRINQAGGFVELEGALVRNWRLIVEPINEGVESSVFSIDDKHAAAAIFWGGLQGVITQAVLNRIKLKPGERRGFFDLTARRLTAALKA